LLDARPGDTARAARRGADQGERAQPAAAPARPARRRRSDGVLFPQQRSERPVLQRDDPARGVPPDRGDDYETQTARLKASRYVGLCSAKASAERGVTGSAKASAEREVTMAVHETDICIIGGGITSAMLAQKLSELKPGLQITVVEAGRSIF